MLKHSSVDVHVILQNIGLIYDANQWTYHKHQDVLTTMMDSCPDHDTCTWKTKNEIHLKTNIVLHLARVHLTFCWHHCRRCANSQGVKTWCHTGLLGKMHASLSQLWIVWSEILRSPRICLAVVLVVMVQFRRCRTRMYRSWAVIVTFWRRDLGLPLTIWLALYPAHKSECMEERDVAPW